MKLTAKDAKNAKFFIKKHFLMVLTVQNHIHCCQGLQENSE